MARKINFGFRNEPPDPAGKNRGCLSALESIWCRCDKPFTPLTILKTKLGCRSLSLLCRINKLEHLFFLGFKDGEEIKFYNVDSPGVNLIKHLTSVIYVTLFVPRKPS